MKQRLLDMYRSSPREGNLLFFMLAAFLLIYFIPVGTERFDNAVLEAFRHTSGRLLLHCTAVVWWCL